ncbi:MAG: hypothetical protein Q8Q36_02535 [bacterium]|nr:hypothetical protein [bacterium]
MDIQAILVLGHVLGTVLGLGGAIVAEVQVTQALRDGKIEDDERALLHANYFLIRIGMALIIVSGLALIWWHLGQGHQWALTSEKLWVKEIMVVVIIVNAVLLTKHWMPLAFGRSLSLVSWLGATVLGVWHTIPLGFFELLLVYAAVVLLVAFFFRAHAARPRFR